MTGGRLWGSLTSLHRSSCRTILRCLQRCLTKKYYMLYLALYLYLYLDVGNILNPNVIRLPYLFFMTSILISGFPCHFNSMISLCVIYHFICVQLFMNVKMIYTYKTLYVSHLFFLSNSSPYISILKAV